MAGKLQWTHRHNISSWKWTISNDHLRKRLPVWRDSCWFCYQSGNNGRVAYWHHKIARNGCIQLRYQSAKADHMGAICAIVHQKYDTSPDGGRYMVSNWNITNESFHKRSSWLFGTLCSSLFSWFVCMVNGKETDVRFQTPPLQNSVRVYNK